MDGEQYLTVADVSRVLGVSQPRVFQLVVKERALQPAIRVGRSYGFKLEEVEAFRRARLARERTPKSAA